MEYDVVDETDGAHVGGDRDERAAVDPRERMEAFGVDDRQIFGLDIPQLGGRELDHAGRVALADATRALMGITVSG